MATGSITTDQEIAKDALEQLMLVESGTTVDPDDEALAISALENVIKALALDGVVWSSGLLRKARNEWKQGLGYGVADAISMKFRVPPDVVQYVKREWLIAKEAIVADYASTAEIIFTVDD